MGKALCLDAAENHITHIIEACLLSSARTGACAAIAVKQLAVSRRRVLVVGAGRVGSYAAFYVSALQGVEEITFVDLLHDRAKAAAALATETFQSAAVFRTGEVGSSIEADAVIVATTAQIRLSRLPRHRRAWSSASAPTLRCSTSSHASGRRLRTCTSIHSMALASGICSSGIATVWFSGTP